MTEPEPDYRESSRLVKEPLRLMDDPSFVVSDSLREKFDDDRLRAKFEKAVPSRFIRRPR